MANNTLGDDDAAYILEYWGGAKANPYFIEDTLKELCNDNDHPMLQGGQYLQPGFTLLFTMLVLVAVIASRRLFDVIRIVFPRRQDKRADGLVVAASELSYSDQHGLLLRLNQAIPSIAKAFPEGDFVDASCRIAIRDLETKKRQWWGLWSSRSKPRLRTTIPPPP
jgi:hypothetical protein